MNYCSNKLPIGGEFGVRAILRHSSMNQPECRIHESVMNLVAASSLKLINNNPAISAIVLSL